jgi:hypothetical protein
VTSSEVLSVFARSLGPGDGDELMVRNNTSHEVVLQTFTLYDCENIRQECGTRNLDLVLEPGETRRVGLVEPLDRSAAFRYRWRWTHSASVAPEQRAAARRPAPPVLVLHDSDEARILVDERGRFINLVLPPELFQEARTLEGTQARRSYEAWTRLLLENLGDAFDFVIFAFDHATPHEGSAFGVFYRARNLVEGIGLSTDDRGLAWGSPDRLIGVAHLGQHGYLIGGPSLHELAHAWGQRVIPTVLASHWGFAGVGGQMGGWEPGTLEALGDGRYRARSWGRDRFGLNANGGNRIPYSPLELYLMGLLPPDSVPPFEVADDARWVDSTHTVFEAAAIRTVSVDDLIAEHGARQPAWPHAPTEFRALYVVLSGRPLADGIRNVIDEDVEMFSRPGPGFDTGTRVNFWQATGGRATLRMDGLLELLAPPDPRLEGPDPPAMQ